MAASATFKPLLMSCALANHNCCCAAFVCAMVTHGTTVWDRYNRELSARWRLLSRGHYYSVSAVLYDCKTVLPHSVVHKFEKCVVP